MWIVSQTTSMSDTQVPMRNNFDFTFICSESYSSNKVKRVNFIVIHSGVSFELTQKNVIVSDFLMPRASRQYIT